MSQIKRFRHLNIPDNSIEQIVRPALLTVRLVAFLLWPLAIYWQAAYFLQKGAKIKSRSRFPRIKWLTGIHQELSSDTVKACAPLSMTTLVTMVLGVMIEKEELL